MIIYILMLIISLFFAYFASKKEKKDIFYIFLAFMSCVPFFLVAALRYDVGTDYMYRYVSDYFTLFNGGDVNNLEFGFKIIDYISLEFNNFYIIFIISSALIYYFIFYCIFKYSKNPVLSILIFFLGTFYFVSLNMVRQYISISLILLGYTHYIHNKKYLLFILLFFVAFLMHTISIVFIPIFLLERIIKHFKIKIDYKYIFGFLLLLVFSFAYKDLFIHTIEYALKLTRFRSYLNSDYIEPDLQIIPFTINFALLFFMIYTFIKNNQTKKNSKKNNYTFSIDEQYILIQSLAVLFIVLGSVMSIILRISYFFTIFQIISIPYFIEKYYNGKIKKYAVIILIFVLTITCVWTHILHDSDEILPYKSILDTEMTFK